AFIVLILTLLGMVKHISKHARKFILTFSVLVFIADMFSTLLFLMINNSICDDLSDGMFIFWDSFKNTKLCNDFRGHAHFPGVTLYWKPSDGWICQMVATIISFFLLLVASKIVHAKRHGYHVIH
ncbi:hypothetical protein SAMD00019534_041390, partial [Acytostelium subglobosum LB1]|uniref:hypothetical protein n=1 Tax=Acytostelium subglobosum LB1 TaxID=1410327 RepID=UPI000644D691